MNEPINEYTVSNTKLQVFTGVRKNKSIEKKTHTPSPERPPLGRLGGDPVAGAPAPPPCLPSGRRRRPRACGGGGPEKRGSCAPPLLPRRSSSSTTPSTFFSGEARRQPA